MVGSYGGKETEMTVRELISLNQMITDVVITVRKDGSALLDQLSIGCERGVEPRFPTMVPKDERYIGTPNMENRKKAMYIPKSINAWDDGKDYWQVKPNRIPDKWLDLEVCSWGVWGASAGDNSRRYRNVNFHGQRLNVDVLPSGEKLEIKKQEPKAQVEDMEGQMNIFDYPEVTEGVI